MADLNYQIRYPRDLTPLDSLEIDGKAPRPIWAWPTVDHDGSITVILRERDGTLSRRTLPRNMPVGVFTSERSRP